MNEIIDNKNLLYDDSCSIVIPHSTTCIESSEFSGNKKLKKLILPDGLISIEDLAFCDCSSLEEIVIPDSVSFIGDSAFSGCTALKKVTLPNNPSLQMGENIFMNCTSLEEIDIPPTLRYFSNGMFYNCVNLKKVNSHDDINYISDFAFYNCKSLKGFDLPPNIKDVGRMAMYGCSSIDVIHVPKTCEVIETGALSMMKSLRKIIVDDNNEKYLCDDDNTVLLDSDGIVIQYAVDCDKDTFIAGYYDQPLGERILPDGTVEQLMDCALVYGIADYAFAGTKKLKNFIFSPELESFGANTFLGCDNLKNLRIFNSQYGKNLLFHIVDAYKDEVSIPFENIEIDEGLESLCDNISDLFKNARRVVLPKTLHSIHCNVFSKSKYLDRLVLPNGIQTVMPDTFYPSITLSFPFYGDVKAMDFNMLTKEKNVENFYDDSGNVQIFSLKDGTHYVHIDDYDIIKINTGDIDKLSKSSHLVHNNPARLVNYLIKLIDYNADSAQTINKICCDVRLSSLFNKFAEDKKYITNIQVKKVSEMIREIFDSAGVKDEFLFNGVLISKFTKRDIFKIVSNYSNSIRRMFKYGKLDTWIKNNGEIDVDLMIKYCNLLEEHNLHDKFLYNPAFFQKISFEQQKLLVENYNKNFKHILVNSETLNDIYGRNLSDLFNVCLTLGAFDDDEIISQRMMTFLNEKVFHPKSENRISGNYIHSVFSDLIPRKETDYGFMILFIENYDELAKLEKEHNGILCRIYKSFPEISKTSTSHKGSQRQLKVTLQKCKEYFLLNNFEGITEDNKELAEFLRKFYSESYVLELAQKILEQSMEAPRNIFSKIEYDNENNPIYSHDESEDLREYASPDMSFDWLPKQSYDNFVLGKHCSCCAHLLGAGAGIMRASMITDNCQNLVIRNESDEIIAKMTLYVNREDGYAVFNTAEVNSNYHDEESLLKIYNAFIRGANAFVDRYNQNNSLPISIVTIGEYRNAIKNNIGTIETKVYETPKYSTYGYYTEKNTVTGTYNGDSSKQLLVLKR